MTLVSLIAALCLAAVHVLARAMRLLQHVSRAHLISFVGGMAVAFVILRLLPDIARHQETIAAAAEGGVLEFLRNHAYVLLLASVVVFYGLERLARTSRTRQADGGGKDRTSHGVFWIHVGTFGLMNLLVGYLLFHYADHRSGAQVLLLFFLAMAFKFIVNDHSLYDHHKDLYDRFGRWLLAAAVLGGWAVNYLVDVPAIGPALLQAFIAGGVLLNVMKEELPAAEESRYGVFVAGAVSYAVLLLSF